MACQAASDDATDARRKTRPPSLAARRDRQAAQELRIRAVSSARRRHRNVPTLRTVDCGLMIADLSTSRDRQGAGELRIRAVSSARRRRRNVPTLRTTEGSVPVFARPRSRRRLRAQMRLASVFSVPLW